jgi:nucleoid-associated protein YgaU
MALGAGDGGGAQEEAFEVLGEASRKLLEDAKRRFANAPGPKAMKDLMRSVANLAFLGGDDGAAGAAVDQVVPFVEAQEDRAEAAFRRSPTTANLRRMSDAEAGCVAMGGRPLPDPPKELRRVKPGKTHELAAGETLAGIASKYYGNAGFWDVLVRHNPGVLTDPDHPPVGKTIRIPW